MNYDVIIVGAGPGGIFSAYELPAEVFSHLTDELYESKIVYRTKKFEDLVRTFCMNPLPSPSKIAMVTARVLRDFPTRLAAE